MADDRRRTDRPAPPSRRSAARLAALALAIACGSPELVIHVVFRDAVDLEEGAAVFYQGVEIGEVSRIALQQPSPERPAEVTVTLAIWDREVVLREKDRIEISSGGLLKDNIVTITPSPEDSPPLVAGSTIEGTPRS